MYVNDWAVNLIEDVNIKNHNIVKSAFSCDLIWRNAFVDKETDFNKTVIFWDVWVKKSEVIFNKMIYDCHKEILSWFLNDNDIKF